MTFCVFTHYEIMPFQQEEFTAKLGAVQLTGVVARVVVELSRDIESLRGRMGESERHPINERRGRCGGAV